MTPTKDIAFDRFLAAGAADDALGYPNGAQFIAAIRSGPTTPPGAPSITSAARW